MAEYQPQNGRRGNGVCLNYSLKVTVNVKHQPQRVTSGMLQVELPGSFSSVASVADVATVAASTSRHGPVPKPSNIS